MVLFVDVQESLSKGLVSNKDFMCEGYGCVFNPCYDMTVGNHDHFMQRYFELEDGMEKLCENFKLRKKGEQILVKNIHRSIRDEEYYVFKKV